MLALALWVLLIWALWSMRRASLRFLETNKHKGQKKWEQITPMAECFDRNEYQEDDL